MKYKISGNLSSNKTLVLLHGFLCDESTLNDFALHFKGTYKIIAPNLHSIDGVKELNVGDYAVAVLEILNENNIESADFIVHSFGGRVAAKINDINKSIINKIVFIGAAGIKPKFSLKKFVKIKLYKIAKKLNLKCAKEFGSSDYRRLSSIDKQTFKNIINENLATSFKSIKAKTLIVCGSKDKDAPPYMSRKMHKLIANSNLEIIKGAGHFAFLDFPKIVILLADFFLNC